MIVQLVVLESKSKSRLGCISVDQIPFVEVSAIL